MGPRVKKPRSGKAKALPTSAEAEREIVEGGDDKINEETESQEEVHETGVDNGGEEVPPLKKVRGRQNVKKAPAKTKGAPVPTDEGKGKISNDTGADENSHKATSDCDDEEAVPAKKGRGRTKRAAKDEMVGKETSNDEGELEEMESAASGVKKRRPRKMKTDEPEVMPKKKDRGAKKIEPIAEEETTSDVGTVAQDAEESKQKMTKREKRQPAKKTGKNKKDEVEEEKLVEVDDMNGKKGENGQGLDEQVEDGVHELEEVHGDGKAVKKAGKGKAAAKAADGAVKKKPVGRGKKAAKEDELPEDSDVPVDGKKLRVLVEHCKS